MYVYDPRALARLLRAHADVLEANGFPLDPDRFVAHIATTWFQIDHPAYAVIAQAFGASS